MVTRGQGMQMRGPEAQLIRAEAEIKGGSIGRRMVGWGAYSAGNIPVSGFALSAEAFGCGSLVGKGWQPWSGWAVIGIPHAKAAEAP